MDRAQIVDTVNFRPIRYAKRLEIRDTGRHRNHGRRGRRCRALARRVTPDKPRMQIEISSWERWMMRPVINGPRDIRPSDFFTAARFMLATYYIFLFFFF